MTLKDLVEWECPTAIGAVLWNGMDMTPYAGPRFPYPKVKQLYVEWDSLPLGVRLMATKSFLYNKTS